jgi:hypothetical protein
VVDVVVWTALKGLRILTIFYEYSKELPSYIMVG